MLTWYQKKKKKFHTKNYFHAQTLKFCLRVSSDDVYNMKKMQVQVSFRVYTQELFPRCVPSTSLQYAWMASIHPTALQKLSKTHKFESPSSRCCALRSIISIFANPGRHWKSDQFFFFKVQITFSLLWDKHRHIKRDCWSKCYYETLK